MFDEDFKKLVQLEIFIYHCYCDLYELESDGKKDSIDYSKGVSNLNYLLNKELDIINNSIGNDINKCKEWLMYVGSFKYEDGYIDLINNKLSELIGKRLYGIVNSCFNKLRFSSQESFMNSDFNVVSFGIEKSCDEVFKSLNFNYKINSFLELDFLNSVLYFLSDDVGNMFSNKLIKAKYDFIFIHNELEQSMIKSRFEVNKQLYSIIQMFIDCNDISDDMVYSKIASYYLNIFSNNIDYLVYQDSDYLSDNYVFNKVIMDCFIKSSLIYLRESDLLEIRNIVDDEYNSFIYNKLLSISDEISINNIIEVFNSIDDVKNKVNVLSLK